MARSSTSFKPGNTAAVTHGGRSQRLRESYRAAKLTEAYAAVDQRYPALAAEHPILRDLLADEICDLRQVSDYLNRQGGPISDRGQQRKAVEMKRAFRRDVKDTVRLIEQKGEAVGRTPSLSAQLARRRAELSA